MKVLDLFTKGLFGKKAKEEPKNERITTDADCKLIDSAIPKSHNGFLKKGDDYLFPNNVHAITNYEHIAFYKREGQLMASVGHYLRPDRSHDPKARPMFYKHPINSAKDIKSFMRK
jgi:hypothetical protein